MHDYKKLNVWMEAMKLVTEVYKMTKTFPSEEKFGLVSQINRSAVSIPSNIAEGAGRNSTKEFINYLTVANASSYELETQLLISRNLGYINDGQLLPLTSAIETIQKMIFKLIKNLKTKI